MRHELGELLNRAVLFDYGFRSLQIMSKHAFLFYLFFLSAHFLGKAEFGLLNYWMSVLTFLLIFCDFGINPAVVKHIAEERAKGSKTTHDILFSLFVYFLVIGTIVCVGLYLVSGILIPEVNSYLFLLYPLIFLVPFTSALDGYYTAHKRFRELSGIYLGVMLFVAITAYFLITRYALLGSLFAYLMMYALLFFLLFVFFKERLIITLQPQRLWSVLRYGCIIGLSIVTGYLFIKLDVLLLGHYGLLEQVGRYEIVNKIFFLLLLPFHIFNGILVPDIVRRHTHEEYARLREMFLLYGGGFLLVGTLFSAILYVIFPYIFSLVLPSYFDAITWAIFVAYLFVFPVLVIRAALTGAFLSQCGYAHHITVANLLFGTMNIAVNWWFLEQEAFLPVVISTLLLQALATLAFVGWYLHDMQQRTESS